MSTLANRVPRTTPAAKESRNVGKRHYGTHIFLTVMAVMWLIPLGWALFTALRPKADTDKFGYFSFGGTFNFDNFVQVRPRADSRSTS
ncbi:hypothetical protein [Arthrobacter sp. NA-172]|uniref:hypothetical protein n=1 Tax=Arthrobacter sp. NA-172 TaxID=3367524 RepID=UPI003754EFBA